MSYNIDELEKAFGVDQGDERDPQVAPQPRAPRASYSSGDDDEKVMDLDYIRKVTDNFSQKLRKVGAELQELEEQTQRKRLEFTKLQGAFEVVAGFRQDLSR